MKKIVEFQKAHNLVPDGIIGPFTLNALKTKFNISRTQLANLMGQLHHESGGFKFDTESLNYSASALIRTFSYYRKNKYEAWKDGRTWVQKADQQTIANKVYWDMNRSKPHRLGNTDWGDGWKYRGRGSIQVTGKFNYELMGRFYGHDFVLEPELVATTYYWESALWFFSRKNLWGLADEISVKSMTELTVSINGGYNGLDDRIRLTQHYHRIIQGT